MCNDCVRCPLVLLLFVSLLNIAPSVMTHSSSNYRLVYLVLFIYILVLVLLLYNLFRNTTESAELVTNFESSLSLQDILPIPVRQYDKNRAPKLLGQPTVVYFHVTVLSLDSINEESMVFAHLGIYT